MAVFEYRCTLTYGHGACARKKEIYPAYRFLIFLSSLYFVSGINSKSKHLGFNSYCWTHKELSGILLTLCCAMLCYAMPCHAMPCHAMLCYAMLHYAILRYATLCYAILHYAMIHYAMLCYVMLCYTMLCYAVVCYAMTLCYVCPPTGMGEHLLGGYKIQILFYISC